MNTSKQIGEFLKNKRMELGLSQDQVAKLMGFKNRASVFKIEKAITKITVEHLLEYSKKLNFKISEVFETLHNN